MFRIDVIKKIEKSLNLYIANKYKFELIKLTKKNITLRTKECNHTFTKELKYFIKSPNCNCKSCIDKLKKKKYLEKYGVDNPNKSKLIKEKKKKTNLERYGVEWHTQSDNFKKKSKQTNLERYGTEYASQSNEIKDKIKETNLERYGVDNFFKDTDNMRDIYNKKYNVDNPFQLDEIKEKIKQTNLERYGVENPTQLNEIKEKIKQTNLERYGVENPTQSDEIKEKCLATNLKKHYNNIVLQIPLIKPLFSENEYIGGAKKKYKWQCTKCNNVFKDYFRNGEIPRCPTCYPSLSGTSKPQKEIESFIKQYISIEENKRFYFNNNKNYFEIDIYIPEKNIGIELDGIYWHSEHSGGKDRNYHLNKTNFFKNNNIQLIHIWDNEWINKQNIVKSLLLSKIGMNERIYARKCNLRIVSVKDTKIFLNNTHLQGYVGSSVNIGLYNNDKLVQLITFGKSRYNKKYEYEIIRFSSELNITVIGGFSKILKHFVNNYSKSLITYSDMRYSNGNVYLKNGFKLNHISKPNYYYTNDYKNIKSRIQFQKHKLKNKLNIFNPNLTEWENMQLNGYDRIWDCGNLCFIY